MLIKLFPDINKRFALQVNNFHIDSKEIAARQAIHSALLLVKWFTLSEKYSEQSVAKLAATSLNIAFSRHRTSSRYVGPVAMECSYQAISEQHCKICL